jgi:hypothetical protein
MERNHLEGLGVDGRIILKWISNISHNPLLIGHHKLNICNVRFKKEIHKNALLVGNSDLSFYRTDPVFTL